MSGDRSAGRGVRHDEDVRDQTPPHPPVIILDFYGTLAEAVSWGPSLADVLAAHGFESPDEAGFWRKATVDGMDHRQHSVSRDAYVAWERSRLVDYARAAGVPPEQLEEITDDLYRAAKTFELEAYPETHDVLRALRGAGARLAICSNWDWDLPELLERLDLLEPFDVVVTSARAGARKPHPHIYRYALDAVDARPDEVIFVGDSWEPDVEGPLSLGLRAVHVARDASADPDELPEVPPGAHRAPDLRALVDLVDGS